MHLLTNTLYPGDITFLRKIHGLPFWRIWMSELLKIIWRQVKKCGGTLNVNQRDFELNVTFIYYDPRLSNPLKYECFINVHICAPSCSWENVAENCVVI